MNFFVIISGSDANLIQSSIREFAVHVSLLQNLSLAWNSQRERVGKLPDGNPQRVHLSDDL
jgi:hypothetical protein